MLNRLYVKSTFSKLSQKGFTLYIRSQIIQFFCPYSFTDYLFFKVSKEIENRDLIICVFPLSHYIFHFRDVRPNNMYVNEDGNLVLGDFSVASVMGDTRTCTRSTLG